MDSSAPRLPPPASPRSIGGMDNPFADPRTLRRMIVVFGFAGFSGALAGRALDPLMAELALDFAAPHERVALLASAFALPYALVQPVLGPVGDAFGKRRVVLLCIGLLAVTLALCALAPGLDGLFAARIAAGLAAGGIFPLTLALFGDSVPMAQRQVAISRVLACAILGQLAGGAVSGGIAPLVGWRGVMWVCAAAAALSWAVLWRDARRQPAAAPPGPAPSPAEVARRYRAILANPRARPLYGGVFIEGMLVFGPMPFLAVLLGQDGHGTLRAGIAIAAFGLGGFGYALLAAFLLRAIGQAAMMRLAGGLVALGMTATALAWGLERPWAGIGGSFLIGLGFFMLHNSIQVRVTEVAPLARGSAVALHAFSYFLGQSAGPGVFGLAMALAGAVPALLAAGLGVLAVSLWLSLAPATQPNRT